ncbi:MAG TPA: hypothetical protein VMT23_00570 [Candidatus Binatia bacterium]|nr:hypothetical protein [Candidatus Binatia bacterium]
MRVNEQAQFCDSCPLKNLCDGPIAEASQHNVDAGLFSISDDATGVDVSLATRFFDAEGHEADFFPPHTTLDDVANCTGQAVDYKTGFLRHKSVRNCGAFVVSVHRFRESIWGSPEPRR